MANCHLFFEGLYSSYFDATERIISLKLSQKNLSVNTKRNYDALRGLHLPKFIGQYPYMIATLAIPIKYHVKFGKYSEFDDPIGSHEHSESGSFDTYYNRIYRTIKDFTGGQSWASDYCIFVVFPDGRYLVFPLYYRDSQMPQIGRYQSYYTLEHPNDFIKWFNKNISHHMQLKGCLNISKHGVR